MVEHGLKVIGKASERPPPDSRKETSQANKDPPHESGECPIFERDRARCHQQVVDLGEGGGSGGGERRALHDPISLLIVPKILNILAAHVVLALDLPMVN